MKQKIKEKLKEFRKEYNSLRKKVFEEGNYSQELVDKGAYLEGKIEELKYILNSLEENRKLESYQIDTLIKLNLKTK